MAQLRKGMEECLDTIEKVKDVFFWPKWLVIGKKKFYFIIFIQKYTKTSIEMGTLNM